MEDQGGLVSGRVRSPTFFFSDIYGARKLTRHLAFSAHVNSCGQDRILRIIFLQRFVLHPSVCHIAATQDADVAQIVPYATYHLFRSIKAWSNLESLTLTNIAFPFHGSLIPIQSPKGYSNSFMANLDEGPFLPLDALINLRNVYIGQATFVPIRSITKLALAKRKTKHSICGREGKDLWHREREVEGWNSGLREIRLVDAYKESIWQQRIRRKDLEAIAMEVASSDIPIDSLSHVPTGGVDSEAVVGRIREIVSCEALTERIIGGDRAEGMTTLD